MYAGASVLQFILRTENGLQGIAHPKMEERPAGCPGPDVGAFPGAAGGAQLLGSRPQSIRRRKTVASRDSSDTVPFSVERSTG